MEIQRIAVLVPKSLLPRRHEMRPASCRCIRKDLRFVEHSQRYCQGIADKDLAVKASLFPLALVIEFSSNKFGSINPL